MPQGQSPQVGSQTTNRAFSRFAHVIGYTCLSGALLDVIGFQGASPSRMLWPALIPLVVALVALVLLDRWRTTFYSVLFLTVGTLAQLWLMTALLTQLPAVTAAYTAAFSLVPVALILVIGPGFVPRSAIVWCTVGFAAGQLASYGASVLTGTRPRLDIVSIAVEVGVLLAEGAILVTRRTRPAVGAELDRAAVDEELSALRYRIEVRAASLMHDMVLNHLTAISTGYEGPVPVSLKHQIERDLSVLIGEEWLSEPSPEVDARAKRDWQQSALLTAVQEARELSLSIDVTGELGAIGRLDRERDVAVGLAVKQCLVNVLRHAQIDRAEVVVIGSEAHVSIMVIDAGKGFSEQLVASDRLGIRQSVRRRIETVGGEVQLWSTPGRGTSVLIRVPAAQLQVSVDD